MELKKTELQIRMSRKEEEKTNHKYGEKDFGGSSDNDDNNDLTINQFVRLLMFQLFIFYLFQK